MPAVADLQFVHVHSRYPVKKRKIYPGFDALRALRAACQIQRWFRARCLVPVWRASDVEMSLERPGAHVTCLVEPHGQVYYLHSLSLALSIIATAQAKHPITQRSLLPPELTRLHKGLCPKASLLLGHTLRHATKVARACQQSESLAIWLQSRAGEVLDTAITLGEPEAGVTESSFDDALRVYEDAVMDVHFQCFPYLHSMLVQHKALLMKRKALCDVSVWHAIHTHIVYLSQLCPQPQPGPSTPQAAVLQWWKEALP